MEVPLLLVDESHGNVARGISDIVEVCVRPLMFVSQIECNWDHSCRRELDPIVYVVRGTRPESMMSSPHSICSSRHMDVTTEIVMR